MKKPFWRVQLQLIGFYLCKDFINGHIVVFQDSQIDEILNPTKANKPLAVVTTPVTVSVVSTWNKQTVCINNLSFISMTLI